MAWNGSDNKVKVKGEGEQRSGKFHHSSLVTRHSPRKHGLVAGLIVVALGGAAVWWIVGHKTQTRNDDGEDARRPSKIAVTKPHIATNKVTVSEVEKPKKYADLTREEKLKYYRDKYGDNLPENLKPIVYYLENPPQRNFTQPKRPESIFKRHSERTIAAFLMMEPGSWMMRAPEFDARFDADFKAALDESIEMTDEDTADQRELKQAVIETKKELAARIKNGETASEIMSETAQQMYELGQYRRNIEDQVAAIRRNAEYSDQDLSDYVTAANQMLEKKGLKPLRMPNMMLRHISIKQRAARAAQKAKEQEMTK